MRKTTIDPLVPVGHQRKPWYVEARAIDRVFAKVRSYVVDSMPPQDVLERFPQFSRCLGRERSQFVGLQDVERPDQQVVLDVFWCAWQAAEQLGRVDPRRVLRERRR